ncbi:MAG: isoprenyl transferase [Chitinivibrionales bacterium]|nr:isoprenyl transferase [Chitinivibrionales bacterium]MBD3394525.1 isoprenyl transferase [Chitinivibrionales bacterium]
MNVPRHIAVIMDGNGRWARKRGLPRTAGHRAGTDATRRIVRACGELGIEYLTIYTFSAENWERPRKEVTFLMGLFVEMIQREINELNKNNVRLHAIGDIGKLPAPTRKELEKGIESTARNTGLNLILAISYGGRAEIVRAAKLFARDAAANPSLLDSLNEERFSSYLYTKDFPDPELIVRTGGDVRISNFLIWQVAYAELHVTDVLWPDFDRDALVKAIEDFNGRERRFGKVVEQQ